MEIRPIAHLRSDFPEKFGLPRQSGMARSLRGRIVFEREFRNLDALRGMEGVSHLWLIWEFSANRVAAKGDYANGGAAKGWHPTVRPPRLGGNTHLGVFATRSPFRPNPLGLSCVEIVSIDYNSPDGPAIVVAGADMVDGTPIYDIKPYIRYSDSHPEAVCGFVDEHQQRKLEVVFPNELKARISRESTVVSLIEILELDPRPSYHDDPNRIYGMSFAGYNVRFKVGNGVLEVVAVTSRSRH